MNYTVIEREGLGVIFALKIFRHCLLGMKVTVVTNHQTLVYTLNKPNTTGKITWWIILLQEIDLEIMRRADTKHINVGFISQTKKKVGVVSEDDDFPNVMLMLVDIENELKE